MLREERAAVMPLSRFWLVLCTLVLWCLLAAQTQAAGQSLTPQEKYVLQQVATGQEADLKARFGEKEGNRRLSAAFLEDLLTGTYKVHRKGVMIKNAIITESLDLENAEVTHIVSLDNCVFEGEVSFMDARLVRHLFLNNCQFNQNALFHRMKAEVNFFCKGAVFRGPVNFAAANIGAVFSAQEAKFESPEHKADFNRLKVGRNAFFDKATFQGPVDFVGAEINGYFFAIKAQFASTEHPATFGNLKVDGDARFDNATFQGPVDFLSADIKGQFCADGGRFLNKDKPPDFEGMRVGQGALFRDVTCRSDVELTYGTFLDLYFQGAREEKQDEGKSRATLRLTGTHIQRELHVSDLRLKSLKAGHLRVKGPATFQNLGLKESADFQNAALETLKFEGITWPEKPENLKLDGLTYTSLCVDGPNNFDAALGLVQRSAFNPQNYLQLEDFCKRRGHPDWADTVSIAMKDRELDQRAWYTWWLKKIFWGWPAGYGRKPMRLLVASLIIILVGAALFNPKYLENDKNPLISSLPSDPEYSVEDQKPTQGGKLRVGLLRFLISLDQFLPAVNLGLADHWKAKDTHFLVWLFFTVEQGFGWIFVSIGLAAVYTQIK